jgi:hypothetical protein
MFGKKALDQVEGQCTPNSAERAMFKKFCAATPFASYSEAKSACTSPTVSTPSPLISYTVGLEGCEQGLDVSRCHAAIAVVVVDSGVLTSSVKVCE